MAPFENFPIEDKPQILLALSRTNPSEELVEKAIHSACYFNGFNQLPKMFSDKVVLDDVARADIFVADVSVLDPNLFHILGIADGLRIPVLYTCIHGNTDIPANLQGIRIIYYDDLSLPDAREALTQNLTKSLRQVLGIVGPEIIDSFGARTRWIIHDLNVLLKMHDDISLDTASRTIWYSGVLSDFAMNVLNLEPDEIQFKDVLMAEKQAMIDLVRKGCRVVSPFRQKNCYLIGNISCIERFQKSVAQKTDITLRQTDKLAITANRVAYEALFGKLIQMIFHPGDVPKGNDLSAQLRQRTIKHLSQMLTEYNSL